MAEDAATELNTEHPDLQCRQAEAPLHSYLIPQPPHTTKKSMLISILGGRVLTTNNKFSPLGVLSSINIGGYGLLLLMERAMA